MEFKIGVIGATGYIATPYRKEIRECGNDARIVALCARRWDLLEAAQAEDSADLITDNWCEVVDHPDVNLVIVATPDALHHEAVMACAERGKHVVCEKPVGVNVAQAHEMWCAYRDAKLAHFVPLWTRYVPAFVRAREIVRDGTLGDIRAVIYRWHNPRPPAMPFTWRDDVSLSAGGSIADVGSHAYETLRWILDQEAVRVLSHADVISPAKADLGTVNLDEALDWGNAHTVADNLEVRKGTAYDYADIAFVLENGAVGSLVLSHAPFLRKGLAPELELHGTDASLALDRLTGNLTLARADGEVELFETVADPGFGNRFARHVFPALQAQIAGQNCEFPGLDVGWRVQLFTDAAALSAQQGSWVKLDDLERAELQ
jgi:predicted dehydrogenase